MSDKPIKIYAKYFLVDDLESAISWLGIQGLPFVKNLVWDDKKPDYIITSDKIYHLSEDAQKFLELVNNNPDSIRIFVTYEAIFPDFNIFDYAVSPNYPEFAFRDRSARYVYSPEFYGLKYEDNVNNLTFEAAKSLLRSKKRFCNFIYSNGNAHPYRDKLFHAISEYKHVDSLGHHLNNINTLLTHAGIEEARYHPSEMKFSLEMKSHYKFSIACENARFDGYISEKLLTSFAAHTVPIYWGNPIVAEEYNPEAFINCNDYSSFDEIIKRIREIDEDDDLWAYMVSQPWQTEEQRRAAELERRSYEEFMTNIFTQPLEKAKRHPKGFWPGIYEGCFWRGLPEPRTLSSRIMGLVKHPSLIIDRIQRRLIKVFPSLDRKPKLKLTDINDFFRDD